MQGDLNKALVYLQKAYELNANDYEVNRLLGVAHGIRGETQLAIQYFNKNVQQAPDNAMAWWNLAVAYYNAGDQANGQQAQAKALELDPDIQSKLTN